MRSLEIKENLEKVLVIGLTETPKEELLKLELSGGGKVISISDYLKQKGRAKD